MSQIVLIEDDLFFSSKIENILKHSDFTHKIVHRKNEVLDFLKENSVSLILINLASSNLRPLELVSEIKSDSRLTTTPILGYCGHTQKELIEQARKLGCDKVVPNSAIVSKLPKLLNQIFQTKS